MASLNNIFITDFNKILNDTIEKVVYECVEKEIKKATENLEREILRQVPEISQYLMERIDAVAYEKELRIKIKPKLEE